MLCPRPPTVDGGEGNAFISKSNPPIYHKAVQESHHSVFERRPGSRTLLNGHELEGMVGLASDGQDRGPIYVWLPNSL